MIFGRNTSKSLEEDSNNIEKNVPEDDRRYYSQPEEKDENTPGTSQEEDKRSEETPSDEIYVYIGKEIGDGAFSRVYSAKYESKMVALKIEDERDDGKNHVELEFNMYKAIGSYANLPKIYCHGYLKISMERALVMELLGPSLSGILKKCGGKFTMKTVCMVGLQMLDILQFIHSRNIIHRDVKPENCVLGREGGTTRIYLTDFGLARYYIEPTTKQHIPFRYKTRNAGTAMYMSINSHKLIEQSRRDDLESLGYMLIRFIKGFLPWKNITAESHSSLNNKVLKVKQSVINLCRRCPYEMQKWIYYCRSLKFSEPPNYDVLRQLLLKIAHMNNFQIDHKNFDWTKKNIDKRNSDDTKPKTKGLCCIKIVERNPETLPLPLEHIK